MLDDEYGWRPVSLSKLFSVSPCDERPSTREEIISDAITRCLASGRVVDEERMVSLSDILADDVVSGDFDALDGFSELDSALESDYTYYDASRHLEGFSEGAVWGMLRMADSLREQLLSRSDSALPVSVLRHGDVLLGLSGEFGATIESLARRVGVSRQSVVEGIVSLQHERLVVVSIVGTVHTFVLSNFGECMARRLREAVHDAVSDTCGSSAVEALRSVLALPDDDMAARVIRLSCDGGA